MSMNRDQFIAIAAKAMTEAQLQAHVMSSLRTLGWRTYHTWNSKHSEKGFPDIVALKGGRGLVAELKRQNKSLPIEQVEWLRSFKAAGFEAYEWRPIDWLDGTIPRILQDIARMSSEVER